MPAHKMRGICLRLPRVANGRSISDGRLIFAEAGACVLPVWSCFFNRTPPGMRACSGISLRCFQRAAVRYPSACRDAYFPKMRQGGTAVVPPFFGLFCQCQPHSGRALRRIGGNDEPSALHLVVNCHHANVEHLHGCAVGKLCEICRIHAASQNVHRRVECALDFTHQIIVRFVTADCVVQPLQRRAVKNEDIGDGTPIRAGVREVAVQPLPDLFFQLGQRVDTAAAAEQFSQ